MIPFVVHSTHDVSGNIVIVLRVCLLFTSVHMFFLRFRKLTTQKQTYLYIQQLIQGSVDTRMRRTKHSKSIIQSHELNASAFFFKLIELLLHVTKKNSNNKISVVFDDFFCTSVKIRLAK